MFYDAIIVGSGIGGLYTCINLNEKFKVLLVSKDKLDINNSSLAQGGIAGVLDKDDSFKEHIEDTLVAGNHKNDLDNLDIMVKEGPFDIINLINLGVNFDRDDDGILSKTLEGGHRKRRIVHHKDKTGKEIVNILIKNVKNKKNIDILENGFVSDIKKHENFFEIDIMKNDEVNDLFYCNYLILATGGIGKIYKYTTNSAIATGDGIAMAYSIGAQIKGLNLIQFHPTALNIDKNERFLISEAVRGEGAYLLNSKGQRFMNKYDERCELAPRDIVARAIIQESEETYSQNIYLDISHKNPDFIKNRFPSIYENCLSYGIDITKDKIPVFPSQHYLMGGINVNKNSESTINNLYAVGECSHTGVHGSNRLASNSLLEGLVFARRAALDINKKGKITFKYNEESNNKNVTRNLKLDNKYKIEIQEIMQNSYFIKLDKKNIRRGLSKLDNILNKLENNNYMKNRDFYEIKNMAVISKLILGSA